MRTRVFAVIRRIVAIAASFVLVASCSDSDPVLTAEGGVCAGTPVPCESLAEAEACRRHLGCYWVYVPGCCEENSPEGPQPCERFADPDACLGQVGCWWR